MSDINLLTETVSSINYNKKTIEDVTAVVLNDKAISWDNFTTIANKTYDNGYGGNEVNLGLKIIFSDKSWLERGEYDGSEWWEYRESPDISTKEFVQSFNLFC